MTPLCIYIDVVPSQQLELLLHAESLNLDLGKVISSVTFEGRN